jgi:alpha-tubulin suppressor-like RCC1 family protein
MGQLGIGLTSASDYMQQVPFSSPVSYATIGIEHALAISDGKLFAWGSNGYGQLGISPGVSTTNSPTLVDDTQTWISCFAGAFHSFAVNSNGELFAWGKNHKGQLGLGHLEPVTSPTLVPISVAVKDIQMGHAFTALLDQAGNVYCTGANDLGQLGQNSTSDHSLSFNLTTTDISNLDAGPASIWVYNIYGDIYRWGMTPNGIITSPSYFSPELTNGPSKIGEK